MRINDSIWAPVVAAVAIAGIAGVHGSARTAGAQVRVSQEAYAWEGSCKKCHAEVHERWEKTKHARALGRLSHADQQRDCVGCHLTGPRTKVEKGAAVLNAGVQCESCHGAAAAHAADPTVRTGLVRKPAESTCTECHNERSPHFKGFFYNAMVGMSHPVRK